MPTLIKPEKITRELSPREYLRMVRNNPLSIHSARIMPPKLGSNHFGKIHVEIKYGSKLE